MKKIKLFFMVMAMLLASAAANAQNMTVTGVVTDSKDVPVIGATVMVEGTQQRMEIGSQTPFVFQNRVSKHFVIFI